jgi:hypothetical protein
MTSVLRQACQIFIREFKEIGKIEVFLGSFTNACNKVLRKPFLKPDTVGLIPDGRYNCNNYSKKALMCLLNMEQTGGSQIMHARNGREYGPRKLPKYIVDGYCPETKITYEFFGCFFTHKPVNCSEMSAQ